MKTLLLRSNAKTETEVMINDCFLSSGLRQVCNIVNNNGKMLDLVFTNKWEDVKVGRTDPIANLEVHHEAFIIKVDSLDKNMEEEVKGIYLNFEKTSNEETNEKDWNMLLRFSKSDFLLEYSSLLHEEEFDWFENLRNSSAAGQ